MTLEPLKSTRSANFNCTPIASQLLEAKDASDSSARLKKPSEGCQQCCSGPRDAQAAKKCEAHLIFDTGTSSYVQVYRFVPALAWQRLRARGRVEQVAGFCCQCSRSNARRSPMSRRTKAMASYVCNQYLRSDSQSHSIVAASMAAHYTWACHPQAARYLKVSVSAQTSVTVARMRRKPRCCKGGAPAQLGCQNLTGFRICRQVKSCPCVPRRQTTVRRTRDRDLPGFDRCRAVLALLQHRVEWAPAETSNCSVSQASRSVCGRDSRKRTAVAASCYPVGPIVMKSQCDLCGRVLVLISGQHAMHCTLENESAKFAGRHMKGKKKKCM
jgi:hypothetical protein